MRYRSLISCLLLLVLVAPTSLSFLWLEYHRFEVREHIEKNLFLTSYRHELVTLTFSRQEIDKKLSWEHSREFEYNRQMYDIISTTDLGDSIQYLCIWDQAESKMKHQINSLLANSLERDEAHKNQQQSLQIQISRLFFETVFNWKSSVNWIPVIPSPTHTLIVSDTYVSVTLPPPKVS